MFIPVNTVAFFGRLSFEDWTNIYTPSYVELKKGVSAKDLEKPIQQLIRQHAPDDIKQNLSIKPVSLREFYLQNNNGIVKRMLYTLSFVGLFLLLMAIINFINISISNASKRMKEIGIRKVMGGLKKQIIIQLLAESILMVFIAAGAALVLYPFATPLFEDVVGKNLPPLSSFPAAAVFVLFLFISLTGISAGLYPAFVLSSLNTIDSLKGKLRTVKERTWLRKAMVGFQFCIAALVMVGAFIVAQQVSFFFSQRLGYDKALIVSSQVPRDWSQSGVQKMERVRNAFAAMPQVSAVTLSYEIPNGNNGGQPPVYKAGADSTKAIAMQALISDENYTKTYGIPLQAGSFFDGNGRDSGKVVLNQQAVNVLGYTSVEDAIGQQVRIPGDPTVFTIKGVTADFHFGSMQQRIAPLIFFNVQFAPSYRYLSFKLKPGNLGRTIEAIQKKWATLLPGSSFEYNFMDETLKKMYASELQMKKAADTATVLALVIVLLGILGLLSISIQKRTKEIGVRKVLGASVSNIISLFLKEFLPVLLLGTAVSMPLACVLMQQWLNNYAYRVPLTVLPFLLTVLLLGFFTVLIISVQTGKAALENPVKNLRTE
jgi:putative ABC transport system permease protein